MSIIMPKGFKWGTATASYQIEGAYKEDGRGESIWDRFSHIKGNVYKDHNGDVACDHYHRFEEDIKLLKNLGVTNYRLSIAWPRIFPNGTGELNKKGLEFYTHLIDRLIEEGIEPAVTLYHWDLPQKLQDKGGWTNRETVYAFKEFSKVVFKHLGDKVKTWITHNEPYCAAFLGYWYGIHAPGFKDPSMGLQACHHILLSHGEVVKLYREMGFDGEIGIVLNMDHRYPDSDDEKDILATRYMDGHYNRWFIEPLVKGEYPSDMLELYKKQGMILPDIHEGDLELISTPTDFLGINYYSSLQIRHENSNWPIEAIPVDTGRDKTDINWEIRSEGLYDLLNRLHKDYKVNKIYITENGAAYNDKICLDGKVRDYNRIDYIERHLKEIKKSIDNGVNVAGYYVWSLMDNYEWAEGYSKRFGIVYIDYNTLERTPKESYYWYQQLIKTNKK